MAWANSPDPGTKCRGRLDAAAAPTAEVPVLQPILAIEDHERGLGQCGDCHPLREPGGDKARRGTRAVAHPAQPLHRASGDRLALSGHSGHDRPVAQQARGLILVDASQVKAE